MQAKAWLSTVLHPLWRVAQITRDRLEHANPSYRQHSRDFELLAPSAGAISPYYRLNYEQFGRHYEEIVALVASYDERLSELREACRAADDALQAHPRVRGVTDPKGALGPGNLAAYLAEYTINGHGELPTQYSLRDLWAEHGAALLALRDGDLRPEFERIRTATTRLLESTSQLDDRLHSVILELANRHGLPAVDPEALAS